MLFRTRSKSRCMLLLYIAAGVLVFPLYFIYKPPSILIHYFQWRWKDVLWHIPTSRKIVALTIDDAPSPHTHEILQILRANDAAATFFIIGGQVPGQEAVLPDIIRNGSELGNHAMHDEPSRSLSNDALVEQIRAVEAHVDEAYRALDTQPPSNARYFRPGSGFFSTAMRKTVSSLGYRMVLGNVYPHDPQIHSAKLNARHILSMLRPGSIIICHDRRAWTAPMLKEVLPEIKRRGYEIVTVSGLLEAAGT